MAQPPSTSPMLRPHQVLRVDAVTGDITIVAGTGSAGFSGDGGPAISARLSFPSAVDVDGNGDLYIADTENNRIRKVDAATGIITTVAGTGSEGFSGDGGPATAARVKPTGVALDGAGGMYIADTGANRVRFVDAGTGIITTFAGDGGFSTTGGGDGGPATKARFNGVARVAVDDRDNVYINDGYQLLRKVAAGTGTITTIAGGGAVLGDGGPATAAKLGWPMGIAVDRAGNVLLAETALSRIRRVEGPLATAPRNVHGR